MIIISHLWLIFYAVPIIWENQVSKIANELTQAETKPHAVPRRELHIHREPAPVFFSKALRKNVSRTSKFAKLKSTRILVINSNPEFWIRSPYLRYKAILGILIKAELSYKKDYSSAILSYLISYIYYMYNKLYNMIWSKEKTFLSNGSRLE